MAISFPAIPEYLTGTKKTKANISGTYPLLNWLKKSKIRTRKERMEKEQLDIQHHPYDPYEDEIELMDYLKVLWKWKYLILLGTLVCAGIAAIISFNMTKIYQVKMVVAPGILKIDDNGKRLYIDSLKNIQTMIESGTFDEQILAGLGENAEGDSLSFKVEAPKGLNALRISLETADKAQGFQISDFSRVVSTPEKHDDFNTTFRAGIGL